MSAVALCVWDGYKRPWLLSCREEGLEEVQTRGFRGILNVTGVSTRVIQDLSFAFIRLYIAVLELT